MLCRIHDFNTTGDYGYVVVLSTYQGKILLSRHKDRSTWETQGGHIEAGETPLEAAKRELYEESGATQFELHPLCDYWVGKYETDPGSYGMVFVADILELSEMPVSEMAEVRLFEELPDNVTYPHITPSLFARRDKYLQG